MVVDCKHWGKKLAVPHVEAFAGLVDDVAADLGLLVTSTGFRLLPRRGPRASAAFASTSSNTNI
jgi:Restriction endonuclease